MVTALPVVCRTSSIAKQQWQSNALSLHCWAVPVGLLQHSAYCAFTDVCVCLRSLMGLMVLIAGGVLVSTFAWIFLGLVNLLSLKFSRAGRLTGAWCSPLPELLTAFLWVLCPRAALVNRGGM